MGKYYVVLRGRKLGIFENDQEYLNSTRSFPNAAGKSFNTLEALKGFVLTKLPSLSSAEKKKFWKSVEATPYAHLFKPYFREEFWPKPDLISSSHSSILPKMFDDIKVNSKPKNQSKSPVNMLKLNISELNISDCTIHDIEKAKRILSILATENLDITIEKINIQTINFAHMEQDQTHEDDCSVEKHKLAPLMTNSMMAVMQAQVNASKEMANPTYSKLYNVGANLACEETNKALSMYPFSDMMGPFPSIVDVPESKLKRIPPIPTKKQKIVSAWREAHPEGTQKECQEDTHVSMPTIKKWWDSV